MGCDIKREDSGLAMSSRNVRLSTSGLKTAEILIEQLKWAKENYPILPNSEIEESVKLTFQQEKTIELEYFEIAETLNLQPVNSKKQIARAFIAAHIEGIRLIDNIALN